jgi:hypothetical protein
LASIDATLKGFAPHMSFVNFADQIILPGIYATDAAMGLTGTVYLNIWKVDPSGVGPGGPTVVYNDLDWSLYLTGAMTTGAGSKVVFVSKDPADYDPLSYVYNAGDLIFDPSSLYPIGSAVLTPTSDQAALMTAVHWKIIGAITVGMGSNISGDMKSNGAITVCANARVGGKLEALGAVTLGPDSVVAGTIRATGAITEGGVSHGGIYNPATADQSTMESAITVCENHVAAIVEFILGGPGYAPYQPCMHGILQGTSCACDVGFQGNNCEVAM